MKQLIFNLTFMLCPFILFGQWNQMGSSLEGEFDGDSFGYSVALNYEGDAMIVGAYDNPVTAGNTLFPGMVRVFDWNGTDWIQRGDDIDGTTDDWSGFRVDIDSLGNTIAVTSIYGDNNLGYRPGLVRIYDWDGSNWTQRGNHIEGDGDPIVLEWFGSGLSLSADGNTVGIGGPNNLVGGFRAGFAEVYTWNGTSWTQVGNTIYAGEAYDNLAQSLSLNSDGTIVALGGPGNLGYGNNQAGQMRVFQFDGTNWNQMGSTIYGDVDGDDYGRSVSLNSSGTRVAVGANRDNFAGSAVDCKVYIYEWNGTDWVQLGNTLVGSSNLNNFGSQVRLDYTGNRVAASAPEYWSSGEIQVFEWNNTNWTQVGSNILGDATSDIFGSGMDISGTGTRVAGGAYGHGDRGQAKVYEFFSDVGIDEENMLNLLTVYPNPTEGMLNISHVKGSLEIELTDLDGRIIQSENWNENGTMDISDLPSGIYLMTIRSEFETQSKRVIKL